MNPTEFSISIKQQIDDGNTAVILLLEIIHALSNNIDDAIEGDYLFNSSELLAYAHIQELE